MSVKQLIFVDNNPPQCDAEWLNSVKDEINNAIVNSGQTLNIGDKFQLSKAVKSYLNSGNFYTDSGAADAYILSTFGDYADAISYTDGMLVRTRAANSNTAASTVNIDGIGAKPIKKDDGGTFVDVVADDIVAGTSILLEYNASEDAFILLQFGGGGEGAEISERLYNEGTDFTEGVTATLTLPSSPAVNANVWVYFDGVIQFSDNYSITGNQITFTAPIPVGISQVYVKVGSVQTGGNSVANISRDIFARSTLNLTTGQTVFTLSQSPASENGVVVIENNVINTDFTLAGNVVTLGTGIAADVDQVTIISFSPLDIGTTADGTVTLAKHANGNPDTLLGFNALGVPEYVDKNSIGGPGFVLAGLAWTPGGLISLNHNFGNQPTDVMVELEVTVANNGYAVGDRIPLRGSNTGTNSALQFGYSARLLSGDLNNTDIRIGSNATGIPVANASTGGRTFFDPSECTLRISLWK